MLAVSYTADVLDKYLGCKSCGEDGSQPVKAVISRSIAARGKTWAVKESGNIDVI